MNQVEFQYNDAKTIIQCNSTDKMKDIIKKFFIKVDTMESKIYFLCEGRLLDEEKTYNEIAKDKNQLSVIAKEEVNEMEKVSSLKKTKNIICPECNENIRILIKDFKISLYECRNGHKIDDMQINEFDKTQYVDQAKIICDICKNKNKSETYDNKFFICYSCKMNLCPLCQMNHDKSHYIVDYEQKDYICRDHFDTYIYYCSDCKKDICALCENAHNGHKTITYGSIMPDVEAAKKELKYLKGRTYELKSDIKEIISKLNSLIENLDNYCKIYNDMVKNFDIRKRNYSILQNMNDIKNFNNNFIGNITEILNDKNIKTKFNSIIELGDKMAFKEKAKFEKEEDKENNTIKGEDNIEENDDKIEEENNNDNVKRYNPSDDKYENFKLKNLEEIQSFTTKYDNEKVMILNDRRILSYQKYYNESGDDLYKLCVYNLNNGIICNINYDIGSIGNMFQMNDDNLIIFDYECLKVFKIKKKSLEEVQKVEESPSDIYKLSNERFLLRDYDNFKIYVYENGKLEDGKKKFNWNDDNMFNDLCEINENEIVIYYTKEGKIYGYNAFLLFYDIKKNKEIKTLKLGDGDNGSTIFLANNNDLIVERNNKLVLIDPKNRNIKKEFKIDHSVSSLLRLNESIFLIKSWGTLYQYEIYNKKITLIEEKRFKSDCFAKYPDNKLISVKDKAITIYGIK